MKKTISIIALSLAFSFSASAAPKVVKKDALPATLKGAPQKAKGSSDGIPTCFSGARAVFGSSEQNVEPLTSWAATHQNHPCFGADTLYVCKAGKNLSVRCE